MLEFWSRYWWVPVVRGLVAVLLGVCAFVWPVATFTALVLVFGALAVADGILAIAAAIAARKLTSDWWVLLVQGIIGVGIGVLTVIYPSLTALALVVLMALWAIGLGVLQVVAAVQLRLDIRSGWWLVVGGILGIAFGILLMCNPFNGALVLVWLAGALALSWGAMLMVGGFDLRRLTKNATV